MITTDSHVRLGLESPATQPFSHAVSGDVFTRQSRWSQCRGGLFKLHSCLRTDGPRRADAAADFGEGVGGLTDLVGFLQAPFAVRRQPSRDVIVQRQVRLAIWNATLATAGWIAPAPSHPRIPHKSL